MSLPCHLNAPRRVDLGGGSSFRNDNTEWFYAQVNKKSFWTGIKPFEVCVGGGGEG